jgi:hypothetical protein
MSTLDTTLVIILTSLLSLFFILLIAAVVILLKLLGAVRRAVQKAESVIDSVEAATDVIKNASGPLALIKVIKNIVDIAQRKK